MAAQRDKQTELEKRRLRAGRVLLRGIAQVEVARRLGLAKSTVSGWAKRVEAGGLDALRGTSALGQPAGLDGAQRAPLVRALKQGAMGHRFATELWTLPRVARLIDTEYGLRYSKPHVCRLLRQLGFTPQRPSKRALERDYVEAQDGEIQLERLPAYAPELNPVEYIWSYLKRHEVVHFCPQDFTELTTFARRRLASMQRRPNLVTAFWKQAELAL